MPRQWPDGKPATTGARWASRITKALVNEVGGRHVVAERLFMLEFHAYHSPTYSPLPGLLPSQQYTFDLLRALIDRGVLVVVGRSYDRWAWNVSELVDYRERGRVIRLANARQQALSPGNMAPGEFDKLVAACHEPLPDANPSRFIGYPDEYDVYEPDGTKVDIAGDIDWDKVRRARGFDPKLVVYEAPPPAR